MCSHMVLFARGNAAEEDALNGTERGGMNSESPAIISS